MVGRMDQNLQGVQGLDTVQRIDTGNIRAISLVHLLGLKTGEVGGGRYGPVYHLSGHIMV